LISRGARDPDEAVDARGARLLVIRGAIGGTLMGLANLVPGISGGTMLLASGVYTGFIDAIAELTTLRFRLRSLLLLAAIVGSAALAILMLAGSIRDLVVHHRWLMYSLFIGLTLGGVPLLWRMLRPAAPATFAAAAAAFALMCLMAFSGATAGSAGSRALLFVSGVAAASAMILPGVSGGYLLLLLGQYETILGTIDQLKLGLLGDAARGTGTDLGLVAEAMGAVIPLGLGVIIGVVGVSNLLRWLIRRFEKATLGALLGLLLGAVVGLWPFQQAQPPEPGDVIGGHTVTLENAVGFDPEDWPVHRFDPTAKHWLGALALIGCGLLATTLIGRLGGGAPETGREPPQAQA
jgi:putative membrane protein